MCKLLWALLALGWAGAAHAIVNIEDLRQEAPKAGLGGEVTFTAGGQSGNTESSRFTLGTGMQWHRGRVTDFLIFNYRYGTSFGQKDIDSRFLHARHVVQMSPRVAAETFAQLERDEFRRLSYRGLAGGGARLRLHNEQSKDFSAYLGLGAFYVQEELEERAGTTDVGVDRLWRGNFYLSLRYRLSDQLRLSSTTYYQPAVDDAGDYRLLEQAALNITLRDPLSLRVSLNIAHDSRPPQGVEATDISYTTGLQLSF